jgi:hypothetical protein
MPTDISKLLDKNKYEIIPNTVNAIFNKSTFFTSLFSGKSSIFGLFDIAVFSLYFIFFIFLKMSRPIFQQIQKLFRLT